MITYLVGDATYPEVEGPKIITHVCNDQGGWGRGFVLALSARWKEPEAQYRRWAQWKGGSHPEFGPFDLGTVSFVEVGASLWVANMIAQHGIHPENGTPPIRYDALSRCLEAVSRRAKSPRASIHMPRIGCGLAGGKWEIVQSLVELVLRDFDVYVYDLKDS